MLLKNSEQRKHLTRLRISAHRLHIEQGRYRGIPRQNRICNRCTSNEIDDEVHFLFSCTSSQDDRYFMNSKITSLCSNFNSLNSNQKLISNGYLTQRMLKFWYQSAIWFQKAKYNPKMASSSALIGTRMVYWCTFIQHMI